MQRMAITITGPGGSGSTTQGRILARELDWPFYYTGNAVRWLMKEAEKEGSWQAILKRAEIALIEDIVRIMEEENVDLRLNVAIQYESFPLELDRIVDTAQTYLLERKDFGVHEGRVVWYLAKKLHANETALDKKFVHILYDVDRYVGAARQLERPANSGKNLREVLGDTKIRAEIERARYRRLYGIEVYDPEGQFNREPFDVVIETTLCSKEATARITLEELRRICQDLFN